MATMVGTQKDLASVLRALVELDYDAIEAYHAAIDRLHADGDKQQLRSFLGDHERHVREVGDVLRSLGATVPTGPDIKRVLTKGKVVIAGLVGDHAVLVAMKTNEDDTNTAYERTTGRSDLAPEVRSLLERNLADERRHRQWIESRLSTGTSIPVVEQPQH